MLVGAVYLLAYRFPARSLQPQVTTYLRRVRRSGGTRFVDLAFVRRDDHGRLFLTGEATDLRRGTALGGGAVWQLLNGDAVATPGTIDYELWNRGEVGFDVESVEALQHRIAPGTSALIALLQPRWADGLSETVRASGGAPLALGFLEPESQLIVGPQLAHAQGSLAVTERQTIERGAAMLRAVRSDVTWRPSNPADVLTVLVDAGVVDEVAVVSAINALASAGMIRPGSASTSP